MGSRLGIVCKHPMRSAFGFADSYSYHGAAILGALGALGALEAIENWELRIEDWELTTLYSLLSTH